MACKLYCMDKIYFLLHPTNKTQRDDNTSEECKHMQNLPKPLVEEIVSILSINEKFIGKLACTNKDLYKLITSTSPSSKEPDKILVELIIRHGNTSIDTLRKFHPNHKKCLCKLMSLETINLSTNKVYTCRGAKDMIQTSLQIDLLTWKLKGTKMGERTTFEELKKKFNIKIEEDDIKKWKDYWVLIMAANIMFNPSEADFGWNHIFINLRKHKKNVGPKFIREKCDKFIRLEYDKLFFDSVIIKNRCQLNINATITQLITWLKNLPLEYKAALPVY
jgi:hypothetical protein